MPPAISALNSNVAGASPTVSFEMILDVRASVVGSFTVTSKVSDAVSPSESVAVRVTV